MSPLQGIVIWITGLPASGKTTLAAGLVRALRLRGDTVLWLDSDDLRETLTPSPTFSAEERDWFYGVIAHLAVRAAHGGTTVVISATAPKRTYRDRVREFTSRFFEIYLECDHHELARRDPKELYAAAARGEIEALPGVGVPYEAPLRPEITLNSAELDATTLTDRVLRSLDARYRLVPSERASH